MTTYKLRVMHPGGTTYVEEIKADEYHIEAGCAYVFNKGGKRLCSYPVMFTIIEKIKYE